MAHANIDERREYVSDLLSSGKNRGMIYESVEKKFGCSRSAISADVSHILQLLRRKTGIYFLIKKGVVVYVGQTHNWPTRLGQHKKDKVFDSYRFIECDPAKRLDYEKRLIARFKPKYNYPNRNKKRHGIKANKST